MDFDSLASRSLNTLIVLELVACVGLFFAGVFSSFEVMQPIQAILVGFAFIIVFVGIATSAVFILTGLFILALIKFSPTAPRNEAQNSVQLSPRPRRPERRANWRQEGF